MKHILLALLAVTTIYTANAQVSLSQLENLNYFEQIELIEGTEKSEGLKEQMSDAQLKRYYRFRAFWDDRIDSEGAFSSYMHAWKNYHNETKSSGGRNSNEPSLLFEQIGPFENTLNKTNFMGRAMSVAVDPNIQNIVYVGGATGGLWKSTNALADASDVEWECLTDDFSAIGVPDIVINPNNSDEIYFIASFYSVAVTNSKLYSAGIYKSTDGGQSWTCDMDINPADENMLTRIVYHPNNTNIMYALGLNSLFKKDTGGAWSQITSNNGPLSEAHQLWEIAINPQNPDEMYASGKIFTTKDSDDNTIYYDEFGLYKSNNGGYDFTDITNSIIQDTSDHCRLIAIDYNTDDNCIYACADNIGLKK
jgi:xyloglucan-specific exo-beta-1,4-glucanase